MFGKEHKAHARLKASETSNDVRWWLPAVGIGGAIGAISPPDSFPDWSRIPLTVIGAVVGAGLLYGVPYIVHLIDSVRAVQYAVQSEALKLKLEHRKSIRAATEALQQVHAALQQPPRPVAHWYDKTAPEVRDAVIALCMPAVAGADLTLGEMLRRLSVEAGSVGIHHQDLRSFLREIGEPVDWTGPILSMRSLVAHAVVQPSGGGAYTDSSTCVLTQFGRIVLASFAEFPPELLERFKARRHAEHRAQQQPLGIETA